MQRMDYVLVGAAAVAVGGALVYALQTAHVHSSVGIDDANITFVYARNLAAGHGFVFNVGGERVEGSTSMLWTLLCALVYKLGGAEAEIRAVGVACFAATQAVLACLLASLPRGPENAPAKEKTTGGDGEALDFLLYFALVFSNPGYLVWNTLTLMDVTLWGATVAFAAWFVAHPPRRAAGFALAATAWVAMCLTRPDALLAAPAFALLAGWSAARDGAKRGLVVGGALLAAAVVALVGLTLFRLWYFGYPLPNTYYAKVAPGAWGNFRAGLNYDFGWLLSSPIKFAAAAAALVAVGRAAASTFAPRLASAEGEAASPAGGGQADRAVPALSAAFLVLCAVPCATGGDHFHEHRFLQPAYPLGCLLLAAWARRERVPSRLAALLRSSGTAAAGAAVVAGIVLIPPFLHERNWSTYRGGGPLKGDFAFALEGRVRAAGVAAMFAPPGAPPGAPTGAPTGAAAQPKERLPSMGVFAAGGTGYAYPGEKFDMLGLNSVAMGHSKADRLGVVKNHSAFDADVFYRTPPDVVDCTESILVEADVFTRGLLRTPKFEQTYAYGRLRRLDPPGGDATLFVRRDFLAKLLSAEGNAYGVRFAFEPIDLALDAR